MISSALENVVSILHYINVSILVLNIYGNMTIFIPKRWFSLIYNTSVEKN